MGVSVKDLRSKVELDDVLKQKGSAALHFWASWCPASAQMDAVFAHLCSENPKAHFFRVEAEEVPAISEAFGVSAVPFFVFIKDGVVVDKMEGANPGDLAQKVAKLGGPQGLRNNTEIEEISAKETACGAKGTTKAFAVSSSGAKSDNGELLKKKLEGIIASKPVMLFIKGSPNEPKCGFSRKVVEILKEFGVEIGSFDILGDEEVRQGMKSFSNWPTFPQLYIAGEFIGGCDIITEMHKSGELKEVLSEKGLIPKESIPMESMESKLKALIHSSPTMLFMKGSPDAPRCGFSLKVVNALREEGIPFGSFDILSNNEVREGLKKYSNWPTYPQLYHNGELIGGCDIILELKVSGELKSELS